MLLLLWTEGKWRKKTPARMKPLGQDTHLIEMGRDEMNLAEFPLTPWPTACREAARLLFSRTASGTEASGRCCSAADDFRFRQVRAADRLGR